MSGTQDSVQSGTPHEKDAPAPRSGGPLTGLRVLDLSRILAGPTCTQLLGDLGAEVIKIERPGHGDDTRHWGPPFVGDSDGRETNESAYYLSSNRNKSSVAVDFTKPAGRDLIIDLARQSDVLIENYRVGTLARHGLSYDDLHPICPRLVYCSITGFGQTGPYADRTGYDFLIQGMGGIMSLTGDPDGVPMKVGVGIADVMCGMYASSAILAALHHRDKTGAGQHIDLSLLDCQVAWLINGALNYLTSGVVPRRWGNGHPNIVPYNVFPASDGHFILAIGNDRQFADFCRVADLGTLPADPRFATNAARVHNRKDLEQRIAAATGDRTMAEWIDALTKTGVPCGPVNTLDRVFADPQVAARDMKIEMQHVAGATVSLIGNPIRFSETPVSYRLAPPVLGQDTESILRAYLGLDDDRLDALHAAGAISGAGERHGTPSGEGA